MTLSATASEDCVSISVVDDSVLEETESLVVSLSLTGVLTSVQLTQHTATILITNDDSEQLVHACTCTCMYEILCVHVKCTFTYIHVRTCMFL